ncbi:MAG: helix-turn-helix domain-containing protein, partial [Thermoleophilia bacterium]|nr:helix-turn-helix domain-containing protein [Thermoleophilia bacterium]
SDNQPQGDTRMEVHANASLTPQGRLTMVRRLKDENWTLARAAEAAGVSVKTAARWKTRYLAEGEAGLSDQSSRPKRIPHETEVPPGWERWVTPVKTAGAGYYGTSFNIDGRLTSLIGSWHGRDRKDCVPVFYTRPDACQYSTDVLTGFALKEIAANAESGRPFYMQLDYNAPRAGRARASCPPERPVPRGPAELPPERPSPGELTVLYPPAGSADRRDEK